MPTTMKRSAKPKKKGARGGQRVGAGRPKIGTARTVIIDDERWEKAIRLDKGVAADGIRLALDRIEE